MATIKVPLMTSEEIDYVLKPDKETLSKGARFNVWNVKANELYNELKSFGIEPGKKVAERILIERIDISSAYANFSSVVVAYAIEDIHERTAENYGTTWA